MTGAELCLRHIGQRKSCAGLGLRETIFKKVALGSWEEKRAGIRKSPNATKKLRTPKRSRKRRQKGGFVTPRTHQRELRKHTIQRGMKKEKGVTEIQRELQKEKAKHN